MIRLRPGVSTLSPPSVEVVDGGPFVTSGELRACSALVIHETVTRSADAAYRVLRKRGLSVQLVVDEKARLIQHTPILARCQHAGSARNPVAWGVEVTTPYYEKQLRPGLVWGEVIDALWAHGDRYVLPTREQAETVSRLIAWATSREALAARIPDEWPGLIDGRMALGRVAPAPMRGVLAHTYFGHADGAWLVLYAWLRIKAGLDQSTAYDEARRRTTGAKRAADVRDLMSKVTP